MKHNPLGNVCLALSLVTCAIGAYDLIWFYKYSEKFIAAMNPHLIKVLVFSCLMALSNGLGSMPVSNHAKDFFDSTVMISRQLWVYSYLGLLLSLFDIKGGGGRNEMIRACGAVLDEAKLPAQAIPPPFAPFHGFKLKRIPDARYVWHCMRLVEAQILGIFALIVGKSTLAFQGLLYKEHNVACPHVHPIAQVLGFVNIFFVLTGLAGTIPLVKTLTKIVLPERSATVNFRNRLYFFILPWSAAVQGVLLFQMILPRFIGECSSTHARQVVLAVEMVLFQIASHRVFVPMFTWNPLHTPPPEGISAGIKKGDFQFFVKIEDMARICGGKGDTTVAADKLEL